MPKSDTRQAAQAVADIFRAQAGNGEMPQFDGQVLTNAAVLSLLGHAAVEADPDQLVVVLAWFDTSGVDAAVPSKHLKRSIETKASRMKQDPHAVWKYGRKKQRAPPVERVPPELGANMLLASAQQGLPKLISNGMAKELYRRDLGAKELLAAVNAEQRLQYDAAAARSLHRRADHLAAGRIKGDDAAAFALPVQISRRGEIRRGARQGGVKQMPNVRLGGKDAAQLDTRWKQTFVWSKRRGFRHDDLPLKGTVVARKQISHTDPGVLLRGKDADDAMRAEIQAEMAPVKMRLDSVLRSAAHNEQRAADAQSEKREAVRATKKAEAVAAKEKAKAKSALHSTREAEKTAAAATRRAEREKERWQAEKAASSDSNKAVDAKRKAAVGDLRAANKVMMKACNSQHKIMEKLAKVEETVESQNKALHISKLQNSKERNDNALAEERLSDTISVQAMQLRKNKDEIEELQSSVSDFLGLDASAAAQAIKKKARAKLVCKVVTMTQRLSRAGKRCDILERELAQLKEEKEFKSMELRQIGGKQVWVFTPEIRTMCMLLMVDGGVACKKVETLLRFVLRLSGVQNADALRLPKKTSCSEMLAEVQCLAWDETARVLMSANDGEATLSGDAAMKAIGGRAVENYATIWTTNRNGPGSDLREMPVGITPMLGKTAPAHVECVTWTNAQMAEQHRLSEAQRGREATTTGDDLLRKAGSTLSDSAPTQLAVDRTLLQQSKLIVEGVDDSTKKDDDPTKITITGVMPAAVAAASGEEEDQPGPQSYLVARCWLHKLMNYIKAGYAGLTKLGEDTIISLLSSSQHHSEIDSIEADTSLHDTQRPDNGGGSKQCMLAMAQWILFIVMSPLSKNEQIRRAEKWVALLKEKGFTPPVWKADLGNRELAKTHNASVIMSLFLSTDFGVLFNQTTMAKYPKLAACLEEGAGAQVILLVLLVLMPML